MTATTLTCPRCRRTFDRHEQLNGHLGSSVCREVASLPAVNHRVWAAEGDRYDASGPVTTVCGMRIFPTVDAAGMGPCLACEASVLSASGADRIFAGVASDV